MIRIVTPPAAYPVTLAEAKAWCRTFGDITAEDAIFDMLIAAMVNHAEQIVTGRAYVERTLELNLPCFGQCIELPFPPLLEIESIKYTDINRTEQTVDPATYEIDTVSEPGRVQPVWGAYWPAVGPGFNPVRIRYRAGYRPVGSPPDLTDNSYLPGELRTWMQARICTLYDNRDQFVVGPASVVNPIPRDFADGMLDSLFVGTRLF